MLKSLDKGLGKRTAYSIKLLFKNLKLLACMFILLCDIIEFRWSMYQWKGTEII